MTNIFSLEGRRAIITGGATGLGLAMTDCIVQSGGSVTVVSSSPKEKYQDILAPYGDKVSYEQFDITCTDRTEAFVEGLLERYGKIDILINNAGNHCKKPVEEMSVKDYTDVLNVHLVGAYALTRALLPHMRANRKGSILFLTSMTGYIGMPSVCGYATAKSGVLGLIRSLTSEVSGDGIRVNGIAPGWIDTPMFRRATDGDDARKNKILGRTPMNKFGEPADIGWACVYLCSDAAKFVTGTVLTVDGGAVTGF